MKSSPLELQFSVERLKRFLQQNPDKAAALSVLYVSLHTSESVAVYRF